MSDRLIHPKAGREREAGIHWERAKCEARSEGAEAIQLGDVLLGIVGPGLGSQASVLSGADGRTRAAALTRLQQTRGNTYVQRLVANGRSEAGPPLSRPSVAVQRGDEDFIPKLRWGDWNILPPMPKTETDDRYDDWRNRERAERKAEDERSGDQSPYQWWTQPPFAPPVLPPVKKEPSLWPSELPDPGWKLPAEGFSPGDYNESNLPEDEALA